MLMGVDSHDVMVMKFLKVDVRCSQGGVNELGDLLVQHDEICGPHTQAFDNFFASQNRYAMGKFKYNENFQFCKKRGQYLDTVTMDHSGGVDIAVRMNETFTPKAMKEKKLIFVLREPVVREFKMYREFVGRCYAQLQRVASTKHKIDLERECNRHNCNFVGCKENKIQLHQSGMTEGLASFEDFAKYSVKLAYAIKIRRFLRVFGPEQMLIVNFDDFARNSTAVKMGIASFLGLTKPWSERSKSNDTWSDEVSSTASQAVPLDADKQSGEENVHNDDKYDNKMALEKSREGGGDGSGENVTASAAVPTYGRTSSLSCRARDHLADTYASLNGLLYALMAEQGLNRSSLLAFSPFADPRSYQCYDPKPP